MRIISILLQTALFSGFPLVLMGFIALVCILQISMEGEQYFQVLKTNTNLDISGQILTNLIVIISQK